MNPVSLAIALRSRSGGVLWAAASTDVEWSLMSLMTNHDVTMVPEHYVAQSPAGSGVTLAHDRQERCGGAMWPHHGHASRTHLGEDAYSRHYRGRTRCMTNTTMVVRKVAVR